MEVRYSPDQVSFKKMNTGELRKAFLIDSLFQHGKVEMIYSDIDRSITGSAVPTNNNLKLLASRKEMAADYFTERREVGIINIGEKGIITVDGEKFLMEHKDCLYIGRGSKEVEFGSSDPVKPAKFYFTSYPAHKEYPVKHLKFTDAEPVKLGEVKNANKRTIYKYIYEKNVKSCQLVMGLTELETGSNWNTMPVHTHQRRSEIYMYFNLSEDSCVFHFLGEPDETRHIVVRSGQAVLSPSYSIHSGVGTQNYSFIWSMGGENQDFDDMDWVDTKNLK